MDPSYTRNRIPARGEIQSGEISEGRAALDDNILCSQLSCRPTPLPVPRRGSGIVTYPTFNEANTLAIDSLDEQPVATCCSRTHNQSTRDYHHVYFSDMARSDHSKVLGYRPLHIITRFGERDLFSRLHLSVTELYTRHVGCHMGVHNHFLERVPAFGCGGLFSSIKTFQRKYFTQYSSYVCGTCEQISIRRPGPAYICNRCDSRPLLLRCTGCKSCEKGGTNNCSGFVLPSGDKFQCGNFCWVILITNKDHYNNCRNYIIRRWGPAVDQLCHCGQCVNCLDREVNGPGNEHQGHEVAKGSWHKNEDLTPPPVSQKDREFARADDNRKRLRKAQYKENCANRHREHSQEESY